MEPITDTFPAWPALAALAALALAGACVRVPSAQVCAGVTAPLRDPSSWNPPSANASVCVDVAGRAP